MQNAPPDPATDETPPVNLRFLKALVTLLTATMILGLIAIIALLVIRLPQAETIVVPDRITLPSGTTATAFTKGPDWFAVTTRDNQILIYDSRTNALLQTVEIRK